ncbi:Abi family protein [Streptococcus suis]|nr:Abi family protein [Streptococcus suis]NQH97269.1 Abi family protein [Streptococcus suis]NQM54359.1 Abi family protein [Streptococcus suis]NQO47195.1 Abi family protein [Streptococcus suis]WNF84505.1 Abi family protein [Streptococcus suis]
MVNKVAKPKKFVSQLVSDMKDGRGITFNYVDEAIAIDYLSNTNNYLRTAAYRKNYQKYQMGSKKEKYINLDFSYLIEMSVLDMHYRFLIQKMCSDIEHSMCVQLIRDIENDSTTDGYDLVHNFFTKYPKEIKKVQSTIASPHTGNLLWKYFTIVTSPNGYHRITNYDDCPVWVLMELLSFGSIINFYLDYYSSRGVSHIPKEVLNLVRSLRNAAAHNNCILSDLNSNTTVSPQIIIDFVKSIEGITTSSRRKKLSSRAVLEFVALIYVYDKFVTGKVRKHRLQELNLFINKRMVEKSGFFRENDLIKSTYKFIHHIVNFLILRK